MKSFHISGTKSQQKSITYRNKMLMSHLGSYSNYTLKLIAYRYTRYPKAIIFNVQQVIPLNLY